MNEPLKDPDRLYKLLPALYRELETKGQSAPLRSLLALITQQADVLEQDIENLWNNFFIETCEDWVIPYIADLVGNNLLHDVSRVKEDYLKKESFDDLRGKDLRQDIAVRSRADVAKTIYYRRRKGTLPMLEELARDVTGWAAHTVEFFQLLGCSQNLNHLRLDNIDCLNLTHIEPLDRLNGTRRPFDQSSHTVDVRQISQTGGWYNIKNIGFFLWRLKSYRLKNIPARQENKKWQYHFSPLGNPMPLFSYWRREGDEAGLATEFHVPTPIRHAFFYEDLQSLSLTQKKQSNLYGSFEQLPDSSLFIFLNGTPIHAIDENTGARQIVCRRLKKGKDDWRWPDNQPKGKEISVDVETGRLALGEDWGPFDDNTRVDAYYHYGFSATLGGGPYDRQKWLIDDELEAKYYFVKQDGVAPPSISTIYNSLIDALVAWETDGREKAVIQILDSRTYELQNEVTLSNESWLVIEAANEQRPLLKTKQTGLNIDVLPPAVSGDLRRSGEITFSGVVVEGFISVIGDLGRLRLLHTTLVPGRTLKKDGKPETKFPSLIVREETGGDNFNTHLVVEMAFSITGSLRMPEHAKGLWLADSIVDGVDKVDGTAISTADPVDASGPPIHLERVTIYGKTFFKRIDDVASEVIFTHPVMVSQRQKGCVRFSYVPAGSSTPQRYKCQPALEVAETDQTAEQVASWLVPMFTSRDYGRPGYAQLAINSPIQIRTGAEDTSEMGAFCHLKQPQCETNLRIRREEYLPFGLDAGIIYVT